MRAHLIEFTPTSLLIAVLLLAASSSSGNSQGVGVTAATNPVATGQAPGQSVRELRIGLNIVRNERIRTTEAGATQVIFTDRTTLTIGPNSDITIDEYVYNPDSNSGSLAVRMGTGVMKIIGGQISHSDQTRITTPTATLGIRGGIAIVSSSNTKTSVVHLYGTITVSTSTNTVTFSKPGFFVESNGKNISPPNAAPPGFLTSLNTLLSSKPGQTGGAPPGLITPAMIQNAAGNGGQFFSLNQLNNYKTLDQQHVVGTRPQTGQLVQVTTGGVGGMGGMGGMGHHFHHHHHHFFFFHGHGPGH